MCDSTLILLTNFWVIDQKIRSMQQQKQDQRVRKSIIIEDQDSQRVQVGLIELPLFAQKVELCDFLRGLISDLADRQVRVYDFLRQCYVAIPLDECSVSTQSLGGLGMVLVKVKRLQARSIGSTHSNLSSQRIEVASVSSSVKRERSKERVIFQVIEIVKQWRQLHLSRGNLHKVSLQEAAKMVGLPKKSLDDYYYQLRLGEKYDFDFRVHLFDRIGVLRTYLKGLKHSSKLDKTEKHPKRLKIIDDFDQLSQIYSAQRQFLIADRPRRDMEQQIEMKIEEQGDGYLREQAQDDEASLQDHFYNEFEYMLNDKDPFLSCDFNFKKKGIEDNSSQEPFF